MVQARVTEKWREQIEKGVMPESVHKTYVPEVVQGSEEGGVRKAAFVVSTGNEDRDGDVVNPDGWVLDAYRKNPVVLWSHDVKSLPIARAESIGVEGGKLKSVTVFPQKGVYPFADQVFGLVRDGFLKGTSVGFHPIEATPRKGKSKGIDFSRQELYEFSILPIPSNREALVEAKAAGHDIDMVVKWASDFLDYAEGQGIWIPKYQIQKALRLVLPLQVTVPAVPSTKAGAESEGHATAGAATSDMIAGLTEIVTKDEEPDIKKYIRQVGSQWCVFSKDGKKLGCHPTHAEAVNQLQAVEANKRGAAPVATEKETNMTDVVTKLADELFGDDDSQEKRAAYWQPRVDRLVQKGVPMTLEAFEEACPTCAEKLKAFGISSLVLKEFPGGMPEAAHAGLCDKWADSSKPDGWNMTACMESSIAKNVDDVAAFCASLQRSCIGKWPSIPVVTKQTPPWMKQKEESEEGAPAAPEPDKDGKIDPAEAAKVAREQAEEANEAQEEKAKNPASDPTEADPKLAPILDQLAQGLLAEIEPLKQGGDPTQVATALKAALERFAASFMETYAIPPAQASPAPPGAQPKPQAPPAGAPAAPPQAPAPGTPPQFPPKKGIESVLASLTEAEVREMIQKGIAKSMGEARMHLTGKLPG